MVNFISAILFSFSANLDNIAIGISYGIKKIHLPIFMVAIVSFFTTLFTFFSMIIGKSFIPLFQDGIADSIGAYLLILLGLYPLLKSFWSKNRVTYVRKEKMGEMKKIRLKELFIMTLVLSTNNVAAGIAASATGVNIGITILCSFLFGFFFLFLGNSVGKVIMNPSIQKYSDFISSLLLILIGIIELYK